MKKLASLIMAGLLLALSSTAVLAGEGNNGKGVAGDPAKLLLTRCSNAGVGNGGEWELGLLTFALEDPCLETGSRFSGAEITAILAQSDLCEVILSPYIYFTCEVDPGNSGAHNNAQSNADNPHK